LGSRPAKKKTTKSDSFSPLLLVPNRKAKQKNIRFRVRKSAKTRILFLSCRIPQRKVDQLAVHLHSRREVVKHSRNIPFKNPSKQQQIFVFDDLLDRKSVLSVGNQQRGLSDRTVTNNNALDLRNKQPSKHTNNNTLLPSYILHSHFF
jgi:hypothetical protein